MRVPLLWATAFLFLAAATHASAETPPTPTPREKIGEAQGKPIYRDQLRSEMKRPQAQELYVLFARSATQKYREKHEAELDPTEAELAAAEKYFDREHEQRVRPMRDELTGKLARVVEQLKSEKLSDEERAKLRVEKAGLEFDLKPPGRRFAQFVVGNWKFQKHLYDTYGGGRILWQQAGLEAYDANRKWLEDLEAKGEFKITDPKLRETFYDYWTSQEGSPFLTDDPERIRTEFVEPKWAAKTKPQTGAKPTPSSGPAGPETQPAGEKPR